MLPPEPWIIEIGLNTWLDASCWQYKRNTSHDPHGFLPLLLKHIYPCYPHLYGLVAQLTYYTVKVQNFITHIYQKKKKKTGEVSMFTLTNILIPLLLLIREKLNPHQACSKNTPDICAIGFILEASLSITTCFCILNSSHFFPSIFN